MTAVTTGSNLAVWTLAGTPSGGAARHRTPVVYLHGGPGMYTEARRFDEAAVVRGAGFETIFFDQAGGGKSARLPAGDYSLDRAVADIEALRVAMGHDRLVLWGNSYGADLAALYASRYPGHVAGVLLTSPGMFPGFSGKRDYGRSNRDRVEYAADVRAAIDRIDRDGAAAEATLPQAAAGPLFDALVADELMGGMVCKGASVRPPALPGGGNLYAQRLIFRDLKKLHAALPAIAGIPTLIVRGACDFLPMASAERYRAMLGGEIVEIAGSGHGLIENRAAVDAAIAGFARGALGKVE
ncbi:MAG: alpha/beta fold hydrolase [Sandarakinorhabdus sp.]|nr:alpha/beta fold hydrolase [Sandarakinorhabdus sp.]